MSEKPYLSVVAPLYNEEGNVRELHRRIVEACNLLGKAYEIILLTMDHRMPPPKIVKV